MSTARLTTIALSTLTLSSLYGCGDKTPEWCDTGFGRADDGNCYPLKTCEEDEILGVDGNCYPLVAGDADADTDADTDTDTDSDTDADADADTDIEEPCESTHAHVGWVAELLGPPEHPFAPTGTATIIDDCRIQVTSFNFDGLGDETHFWGASTGDLDGGFIISGRLDGGGELVEATMDLRLPPSRSLDELDIIAVYNVGGSDAMSQGTFAAP